MSRTLCAGVVLYEPDSVLLVRHTEKAKLPTGSYGFPAGRVEEGEIPEDTAVRELGEETGLITSVEYLRKLPEKPSRLAMKNGFEDFIFRPFLCTHYWGQLKPSEKTIPEFVRLYRLHDLFLISDDVEDISRRYYTRPLTRS